MTTSFTILFHKSKNCLCHLSSSDDGSHFAGCLVEHDWNYRGGTIVAGDQNNNGLPPPPSPITSWEDCQTYCRTEQVKYFTWWDGTKCSCRDQKLGMVVDDAAVFGQATDCIGATTTTTTTTQIITTTTTTTSGPPTTLTTSGPISELFMEKSSTIM